MTALKTRIRATLLLVLFAGYYVNITYFPHAHQVGESVIIHSHFYSGPLAAGQPAHSHSAAGFSLIGHLSVFLTEAAVPCPVRLSALAFLIILYPARPEVARWKLRHSSVQDRAPPLAA